MLTFESKGCVQRIKFENVELTVQVSAQLYLGIELGILGLEKLWDKMPLGIKFGVLLE